MHEVFKQQSLKSVFESNFSWSAKEKIFALRPISPTIIHCGEGKFSGKFHCQKAGFSNRFTKYGTVQIFDSEVLRVIILTGE